MTTTISRRTSGPDGGDDLPVAGRVAIAERTVKTHVSNVLAKLALTSRTQAALLARDLPADSQ